MPDPRTLEAVAEQAKKVAALRNALRIEMTTMRLAVVAADRDGHGPNEVVRTAKGGLSRAMVFAALSAADLYEEVDQTLREARIPVNRAAADASPSADRFIMLDGEDGADGAVSFIVRWPSEDEDPLAVSNRLDDQFAQRAVAVLAKAGYDCKTTGRDIDRYVVSRKGAEDGA